MEEISEKFLRIFREIPRKIIERIPDDFFGEINEAILGKNLAEIFGGIPESPEKVLKKI